MIATQPNFHTKGARSLQCYSKTENGKINTIKVCPAEAKRCLASWHFDIIDRKISLISKQDCDYSDELCKGTEFCDSSVTWNSPYLWKNNQTIRQFCCCNSSLCNHESKLRIADDIDLQPIKIKSSTFFLPNTQKTTSQFLDNSETNVECFSTALAIYSTLATLCFALLLIYSIKKGNFKNLSPILFLTKLKQCLSQKEIINFNVVRKHNDSESRLLSPSTIESDLMSQRTCSEEWKEVFDIEVDFSTEFGEGAFGNITTVYDSMTSAQRLVRLICNRKEKKKNNLLTSLTSILFRHIYRAFDQKSTKTFCFKVSNEPDGQSAFTNETRILQMLSSTEHNSVIKYYGLHSQYSTTGIIIEYCAKGSLRNFLATTVIDSVSLCFSLLNDLASGIAFLHTYDITEPHKQAVVHRDICSANMLLRADFSLVVADFGVSAILDGTDANNCNYNDKPVRAEGTLFYAAPEVLGCSIDLTNTSSSLKHADVYSMSLVMWEVMNRCSAFYADDESSVPPHTLPYQNAVSSKEELIDFVCVQGKRPQFDFVTQKNTKPNTVIQEKIKKGLLKKLTNTVEDCWDKDEDARLTASCVNRRLTAMSRMVKQDYHVINETFI